MRFRPCWRAADRSARSRGSAWRRVVQRAARENQGSKCAIDELAPPRTSHSCPRHDEPAHGCRTPFLAVWHLLTYRPVKPWAIVALCQGSTSSTTPGKGAAPEHFRDACWHLGAMPMARQCRIASDKVRSDPASRGHHPAEENRPDTATARPAPNGTPIDQLLQLHARRAGQANKERRQIAPWGTVARGGTAPRESVTPSNRGG